MRQIPLASSILQKKTPATCSHRASVQENQQPLACGDDQSCVLGTPGGPVQLAGTLQLCLIHLSTAMTQFGEDRGIPKVWTLLPKNAGIN